MFGVQGRTTAALLTAVFNVVVNQKRVVEQFDRDGAIERVVGIRAKRPRGRNTQARAHHFAAAQRIVSDEIVEVAPRFPTRQIFAQRCARHRAVLIQNFGNQAGGHGRSPRRFGVRVIGYPSIRTVMVPRASPESLSTMTPLYTPAV